LLLALALSSATARAAGVTVVAGVRVEGPVCPIAPLSVPAFVDSLRVELASRAPAPGTTLVTLAVEPCDTATARVRVDVASDVGPTAAEREVGLEDIPLEARPRALALAVAELLRGGEPPEAAPPPPAPAPPPPAPAASTRGVGFAADALAALYPARDTALWGGRLALSLELDRLHLAIFGEGAAGRHGYDVGDVDVESFGGGVILGLPRALGRVFLTPGLVGGLAWTRVAGRAGMPDVTPGSGSGLTAALRARLAVSTIFVRVVSVRAFVEAGWVVRGFDATVDGARAAGVSGATIVAGVGLGF
jgi:hypothetical protein